MIDLALDTNWDIGLTDRDLTLISGGQEIAQSAKLRLLFIQLEWVFDYTKGLPWFNGLFASDVSLEQKEQFFRSTILDTVGVLRLTKFVFGVDPDAKVATIQFSADTIDGEIKVGLYT